ncbi:bacillithiol biosynthesis deacetylase BshB1 [Ferruginibacter yonginensis]|uniref:Bacillithiol biosynthesis deacetylase BshB1 n=1 Tax=Ferruginibacter yonginensis TaxID=1310416 RepID=A0ABV8QPQ4_9BACT
MKLDVLAFGVHPDDVELGCAGVLALEKRLGKKTGVIDLTKGELGTRGTTETRYEEAYNAKQILQLDVRENLGLADGFFENNQASQLQVIAVLRKYQPDIVFCNAPEDRHPDHGRSAALVEDAAFYAGLAKIETLDENGKPQLPWRPKYVFNYIQDRLLKADFVVDISADFDTKLASIRAYKTQFYDPAHTDGPQTYISSPAFLEGIIARAAMYGKMIGVPYAEAFISKKTVGIKSMDALVQQTT